VGSWIETARISAAPSWTEAWSQFPTISAPHILLSRFRFPRLSRPFPRVKMGFRFYDLIAWKARTSVGRFLNRETISLIVSFKEADFWIVRRVLKSRKRLYWTGSLLEYISPFFSRTLGELAGSLISGRSQNVGLR